MEAELSSMGKRESGSGDTEGEDDLKIYTDPELARRFVAEAGNVTIRNMADKEVSDTLLENALNLLRVDCFPISLICCRNAEGQKEIWLTSLWAGIFVFWMIRGV